MTRSDRSVARVHALLDLQRQALFTGDLTALSDLPDQLDTALHQLARDPPPAAQMAALRSLAARNADLLLAAQRGIAQIRERNAITPPSGLATYDAAGRRAPVLSANRTLARG